MDQTITLQVGVKVLLQNSEGKYLLLHRSALKYPEAQGRWDIVGGRINPGTPLLDNLKREVKEETDLEIIGEPQLVAAQDILRVPGRHVVRLTYIGQAAGEIRLDEEENDACQWYDKEEITKLADLDGYLKEVITKLWSR